MLHAKESVCLPEKDYLLILDVITQFNQCKSRIDIKRSFLSHLLPLFEAQGGLYGWTDPDISSPQLLDGINIPKTNLKYLQEFIPYDPLNQSFLKGNRSVMASDVDIPMELTRESIEQFFEAHPEYDRNDFTYLDQINAGLVTLDIPEPLMGIGIHRLAPIEKPYSLRDVRVLELLRPHLFQSIKTIALREELSTYRSLTEKLAEVDCPVVLVTLDFRIVFSNPAFEQLFEVGPGKRLKEDLSDLISKEISRYEAPYDIEDSKLEITIYTLPQGAFRLTFSFLEKKTSGDGDLLLVRMKPAVEPYSKINIMMQKVGLTSREIETCILIRDGFENKEIAARLFISLHTVKNHVRNIYLKMGVHTRAQLVALLNKPAEESE